MPKVLAPLQNVELDYNCMLSLRLLHVEKKKERLKQRCFSSDVKYCFGTLIRPPK